MFDEVETASLCTALTELEDAIANQRSRREGGLTQVCRVGVAREGG